MCDLSITPKVRMGTCVMGVLQHDMHLSITNVFERRVILHDHKYVISLSLLWFVPLRMGMFIFV